MHKNEVNFFHYFILFLKVPIEFDIVDVFDLYFKTQLVFSSGVHQSLKQFIIFFERFAYNLNINTHTPASDEVFKQLVALSQENEQNISNENFTEV